MKSGGQSCYERGTSLLTALFLHILKTIFCENRLKRILAVHIHKKKKKNAFVSFRYTLLHVEDIITIRSGHIRIRYRYHNSTPVSPLCTYSINQFIRPENKNIDDKPNDLDLLLCSALS